MRVPDETNYEEGMKKIEDKAGYMFCPHCNKCTITHEHQIYSDGAFYCMFWKRWKRGDDIIEYMCRGYQTKSCNICKGRNLCKNKGEAKFCNRFRLVGIDHHGMLYMGRRASLRIGSDPFSVKAEEVYFEYKRKIIEHKRSGIDEVGEYQENKERNA